MQSHIKAFRPLTVAAFLALVAAPASAATLNGALDAYRNNHVADAEQQLTAVAADPSASADDRATAQRELGRIDWLIRRETDGIASALAATPAGDQRCATAIVALRVYRESGAPATPLADAESTRADCGRANAEDLHVQLARAHLALAASAAPAERAPHLAAAAAELDAVDHAARGAPEIAGPRLSLALAQRNADAALEAWRGYYWLTDADSPQGLPMYAGHAAAIFTAGLAPNASPADILALIEMLNRAGFVDDARLLASQTNIAAHASADPAWIKANALFTFDQSVRDITLRANRDMASGGHATSYGDDIRAAMGQLMQTAGLSGDPRAALLDAYGLYGSLGETSGYPSLHGGHIAEDRRIAADQYGRNAELRFIVIDNMTANGFESWLWDGWAEAGGWSADGAIVQIRSAYTGGPLSALRRTRPGPIRDAYLQRVERDAPAERAALGRDGVATLPATSARLDMQAYEQIAARTGADDDAFIAEVWRATNQYSIDVHEGRHALDNAEGHYSEPQLEYRAKLSQIALADYPRLGLASVAAGTIGDTPHGYGNRRVLEGYRTWMRRHRREITGFDANAPTLTQLDKLTDDQIRTVARGMDPWAR